MTPDEVIKRAIHAVEYAKTFVDDVEFSLEDAGRSEISFMKEVMDAVIGAGARTINLPDTVGYRLPTELGAMVKELSIYAGDRAIISVKIGFLLCGIAELPFCPAAKYSSAS